MASRDIQYGAIFVNSSLEAEIGDADVLNRSRLTLRDAALSIASQAGRGDVACVTTNNFTGYYLKRRDEATIVAISREGAPARVLLSFLKRVDEELSGSRSTDGSGSYQTALEAAGTYTEENRDSLQLAQHEMAKVKQIMVENIDRLLERGERVNLLVDRTGEMSQSANIFNRQATQLQRKMWFQNVKSVAIGAALLTGSAFAAYEIF